MSRVDAALVRALQAVNELSTIAQGEGDFPTMYYANQALRPLWAAQEDRKARHAALAARP